MIVYDAAKVTYSFDLELSRGGEGVVWKLQNKPDLLAKMYLPAAKTPQAKIAWMIDNPPHDPTVAKLGHTSIAWPKTLLFDDKRQFCGFIMPFVRDAVPLLDIYNPRLRTKAPFNVNWQFLHRTARNLCSAVGALHEKGYVIGDVNEGNVVVRKDALISIIDTDSFQVQAKTTKGLQPFHCPVGKEEFTPPELQGKSFANLLRTPHHDSFGLGVIIFLLLMEGVHPFKSHWLGSGDPPARSEKIAKGLFPYTSVPSKLVSAPRSGPSFHNLHPSLQEMFRRCFDVGSKPPHHRPTAEEWEQAVITAEKALIQCSNGHFFSGHLQSCPHCQTGGKGSQLPLQSGAASASPRPSQPRPVRPVAPAPPRYTPVSQPSAGRRFTKGQFMAGGGGIAGLVLVGWLIFGGGGGDGNENQPIAQVATSTATATFAPTNTPRPSPTPGPTADPRLGGGCWTAAQLSSAAGGLQWTFPPSQVILPGRSYSAKIETTLGTITVDLMAEEMPVTVNNFVCLARAGFYDGTGFYRITATALQGGDPTGTGTGGPGYVFDDEAITGEYTRGTLAMVNEGPNTNGSRFFLFVADYSGLSRYPIFGHVSEGQEIMDAISGTSANAPTIQSIAIIEQ